MSTIKGLELPKWGMTMEEGTVTSWLAAVGDEVSEGTALVTVESSKIAGDVEAPMSGVLCRILADAGATVPVGDLVGVVADSGATDEEIDAFLAEHGAGSGSGSGTSDAAAAAGDGSAQAASPPPPSPSPSPSAAPAAAAATPAAAQPAQPAAPAASGPAPAVRIPDSLKGTDSEKVPATPHARKLAAEHGLALAGITATGSGDRVTVSDIEEAVRAAGGALEFGNDRPRVETVPDLRDDAGVPATPHARREAAARGINLHDCRATGRGGRVTVNDVLALAAHREPEPSAAPAAATSAAGPAPEPGNTGTPVPMSSMRRTIGQRLKASYSESPHYRVSVNADIGALLALRRQINDSRLDVKVSVNDLVVAAVAKTLVAVPEVNAQYDPANEVITRFEHADVAVAVSTGEGLITPIVTRADTRTITQISALTHDLATRAKAGTLKPDEFQGGTFTVSNLGMFGVSGFDAIINPPQVAILAVGATQPTFVPGADGEPVAASLLPLTLSSDHRVVDGALAARFLKQLRTLLETPTLIFA